MKKVLITAFAHEALREGLIERGYDVEVSSSISYEEVKNTIHQYVGLVITTRLLIDKPLLDHATNLQWIARLGSGMEIVDMDYAVQKNILCISSPEGNRDAVGEHCLGMLLSLMHNIHRASGEVKEGKWIREANRGWELGSKTVGIIGYGNTGSAFSKLLAPFGVTVLAYDKYKTGFAHDHVREASLEQVLAYSDVISLHLPLNSETYHFAATPFFELMKRRPYFINCSRGSVVDTNSLIDALDKALIAGAGLDVIENEDLATHTAIEKNMLGNMVKRNNVIITPHIAGYSHEALLKMAEVVLNKLDIGIKNRF
jgi:D-3-phosphoglycerate dehydrogenase